MAKWESTSKFYGLTWKTESHAYFVEIEMTRMKMNQVQEYEDKEIKSVRFIPVNDLNTEENNEISSLHLYIARELMGIEQNEYINERLTSFKIY